jgi:hypothetical protein
MHIVTHTCESCGTVVAANELEDRRVMKCPYLDCDAVLRFEELPAEDREHVRRNREQYRA